MEKIGELLRKLHIQCEFRVTELNEKFTKIQLHNFKDKFPILQANKLLRDQAFREKACMDNCPVFSKVYLSDDVSKSVREIRSSLLKRKSELKQKGFQAWIPPVVPPILCYIDQVGEKKKMDWFQVKPN